MKTFYPDEKAFLKANFLKLTTSESLKYINSRRNDKEKLCYGTYRWMIRHYFGFKHENKPELWSQFETDYLLKNYQSKGNVEIAKNLNRRKERTRKFTKKHVEKKIKLLKLKRTKDMLFEIKENNKKRSVYPGRTFKRPIGQTYIRRHGKREFWFIVTEDGIEQLHRVKYINAFGQIPEGHKIYFKDGDTTNCKLDNLVCISGSVIRYKQRFLETFEKKAIPLPTDEVKEFTVRIF